MQKCNFDFYNRFYIFLYHKEIIHFKTYFQYYFIYDSKLLTVSELEKKKVSREEMDSNALQISL